MPRKTSKKNYKIGAIFIILIFCLAGISYSYSGLTDDVSVYASVDTGEWGSCLCIRKTLDGSFTDPETGEDLLNPDYDLNLIHQSDKNNPGFPTKFHLIIEIENDCNENYTDMVITDKIGNQVAPRQIISISHGTVEFTPEGLNRQSYGHDYMTWDIGTLYAGETATIVILIETLQNPSGKYEPTSEDQEIPINDGGAKLEAYNENGDYVTATTEKITIDIDPWGASEDDEDNDNLAIIASPELPYSTPWACSGESDNPCDCCE